MCEHDRQVKHIKPFEDGGVHRWWTCRDCRMVVREEIERGGVVDGLVSPAGHTYPILKP